MKNTKVKVVKTRSHTAEMASEQPRNINRGTAQIKRFSKTPDAVAESDHWVRNEPIPFGLDLFPQEWQLRYADLYYPVAQGGPIYIDTPVSATEVMYCERKLEAYRSKGVRYTYIKMHETPDDVRMRLHPVLPIGCDEATA